MATLEGGGRGGNLAINKLAIRKEKTFSKSPHATETDEALTLDADFLLYSANLFMIALVFSF